MTPVAALSSQPDGRVEGQEGDGTQWPDRQMFARTWKQSE